MYSSGEHKCRKYIRKVLVNKNVGSTSTVLVNVNVAKCSYGTQRKYEPVANVKIRLQATFDFVAYEPRLRVTY